MPLTHLGPVSRVVWRRVIAVDLEVMVKSLQFPAKKLGFETEDDALSWTNPDRFQTATLAFIWLGVLLRVVTFAPQFSTLGG